MRPLGRTNILVSPIGLGLVKLGRTAGLKHPGHWSLPDDAAAAALLTTARDLGINLLDTAPAYGTSEQRLGDLLSRGVAGGRDAWIICTKAGEEFDGERSRFDFSPAAITASVERSLQRLRTDRLDVVLLHLGTDDRQTLATSGALEVLAKLKQAGKVRAIGASTKTPEAAREAIARGADILMLTYNPRDTADGPIIDEAAHAGVGILIKKALLSGHLADLPPADLAAANNDPIEASLRFILRPPRAHAISSIILGTINPDHLRHNAAAANRALLAHP